MVEPWDTIAKCYANFGHKVRGSKLLQKAVALLRKQGMRPARPERRGPPPLRAPQVCYGIDPGMHISIKSSNEAVYSTLAFSAINSLLTAYSGGRLGQA